MYNNDVVRKWVGGIALVVVLSGIGYQYFSKRNYKNRLQNEKKDIAIGYITKVKWQSGLTKRPGMVVYYEFLTGNTIYKNHMRICYQCEKALRDKLTNSSFPVIYCVADPGYSYPLITRRAFAYFKLSYPDSLKWIDDYMLRYELDSLNYNDIGM